VPSWWKKRKKGRFPGGGGKVVKGREVVGKKKERSNYTSKCGTGRDERVFREKKTSLEGGK